MATKIKAPPKLSGGEVHALLKNPSSKGYSVKMAGLLNFLNTTAGIRTGAEIVESDINIDQDGKVISFGYVKNDFVNDKMRSVKFFVKEENELYGNINEIHRQLSECTKIIRSKAKANTEEKKEKAQKISDELKVAKEKAQTELNELRKKIERLKDEERKRLAAIDYPIQTMREKLTLYEGVKIRVDLHTGSYTFPVPVDTPFYREVCNVLGLPLADQVVKKPVIKRMFSLPPEALQSLKKAVRFASMDDLRPAMTCVLVEIRNRKMQVVATDAHRLYLSQVFEVSGPKGDYDYLLPAKTVAKLPKATDEDFSLYELKGGKAALFGSEMPLLDARFPDYRVVIPKYKTGVTFEKDNFVSCVKQVLPFCNKCTNQVNIDINGELRYAAQDVEFSFEGGIRSRYLKKDMPDTVIAFNGKFLIDAMNVFESNEISMLSEGAPTKAGIFTDGIDEVLIMPLMIGNTYY